MVYSPKPQHDKIIILDFGSQYTELIARRIRELNVFCEIYPYYESLEKIKKINPKGIILSGGPASVRSQKAHLVDPQIFEWHVPILGICYGMQLVTHLLGGTVVAALHREYGKASIRILNTQDLFSNFELDTDYGVWMSHGDRIESLPSGFETLAQSSNSPIAAIRHAAKKIYALQFHPEVVHTFQGKEILSNFVFKICKAKADWTMGFFIEETVNQIQSQVGKDHVVMGVSGGVDSTVCAFLLAKAVGKQFTPIFINNGLLRFEEAQRVQRLFETTSEIQLQVIDASAQFLNALKGVVDPEVKRKTIGRVFIEVFEEVAKKIQNAKYLGQGTLYPDVIESVSVHGGPSATIKSHHNVGGLPENMSLKLIEPLRTLFKDEVRLLGRTLGIAEELISRQPFPGPGLAVRILGEITPERLEIVRKADFIVISEMKRAGYYHRVWQSFAVLIPVKTVGVMGDERTYEHVVALRTVTSEDGMTADWVDLPHDLLSTISNRIINEVRGVNRVVYDISSKPPATIEWE
ncbi:MAG: glutamine-hydrolyzing GMP synthase [Deltaproteobacteria bacterium]|nr:glutamine-hydrolyzing GMP synthase [Deltaproteobacteria bacterium]